MKTLEELKHTPRLAVGRVGDDGGIGEVHMLKWVGTVIWSFGGGWEHVSVSPYKRHIVPSWDDMCAIKNMFFREDEVVVQYHLAKSEYVNVVENCLHLWRPLETEMPVPNSLMVGLKKGQGIADVREFAKELEKDNTSTEYINKSSDCSTNWIPCSEQMPKDFQSVLCYARSLARSPDTIFVGSQKHGFWFLQSSIGTESFPTQYEVLAWMPLPELYKPEKGA